ncbi:FabD/lysophospholipase-like protein [Trametes maxima]|nr:FabD/lysophospholipase-like protein [Trametes maxima]
MSTSLQHVRHGAARAHYKQVVVGPAKRATRSRPLSSWPWSTIEEQAPPRRESSPGPKSRLWFVFGTACVAASVPLWHERLRNVISEHVPADAPSTRINDERAAKKEQHISRPEGEKSSKTDWQGLSFLKSSIPVQSISSTISTWTWPVALPTPDFQWPTPLPVTELQERFSALLLELGLGPGSLYDRIVNSPPNPAIHPECEWDAEVRLGEELCLPERVFLGERRRRMKASFARLMGVSESEVDERDLPIVAIAGSGGGYRAMLNTLGSLTAAQSSGLLDCVTYTAGVSGSCWALGILYSGVSGSCEPRSAATHARDRIRVSYLDMDTLDALTTPPTNSYLLAGLIRKAAGPNGAPSLVDLYGTLLASRLYTPSDATKLDPRHLSMHLYRRNLDNGALPLPILSAIQHVTPPEKAEAIKEVAEEKTFSISRRRECALANKQERLEKDIRWLWYEFTPYEVGCDEIGAWIPSWSLGRQFHNGKNTERKPELSFSILAGIFGSAFCASLKHYFREVEPALKLLPEQLYTWLEEIVTENEGDLGLIHPVLPDQLPNFLKGLDGQLRFGSPPDITDHDTLSFMDAGAELNIPYYPFLRRNVDCIIALDASADSQDLWFTRAEELAAKRGLSTWPRGATWPARVRPGDKGAAETSRVPQYEASTPDTANLKLAQTQESALAKQTDKAGATEQRGMPEETKPPSRGQLNTCEVWIGSSKTSNEISARLDDLDEAALLQRDGIAVVYIPLMPNESRVPGFDPFSISTWRREVSEEESQRLLDVAEGNFTESEEKIVRLLRAVWQRKRMERQKRQWKARLATLHEHLGEPLH